MIQSSSRESDQNSCDHVDVTKQGKKTVRYTIRGVPRDLDALLRRKAVRLEKA